MKTVALIGANGQLGTDIQKVFADDRDFSMVLLTHRDIDVSDFPNASKKLTEIHPDIIINTAAYHRVDEIEDNPEHAFLMNSIVQKNLSQMCNRNNWTLVFISTDYVFGQDTKRSTPYVETDLPGPLNVYGLSKLAGELLVSSYCQKHFIVRVCGLYGVVGALGKGGNFIETMIRLGREKGEVSVVKDQVLAPTYTRNVAENLQELLKTDAFGLYHMTSEGSCSWYEFAQEIFRLAKMNVVCKPISTGSFENKARRPAYSVLENANLKKLGINKMRDWKENLVLYMKEKGIIPRT